MATLTRFDETLELEKKFVYIGSRMSVGGVVSGEINRCLVKVRAAYVNVGHLWWIHDVNVAVKG